MKKKRQRQASREYRKKRVEDNHEKMAEEAKKVISDEKRKFTYMAASFMTPHELEAAKKRKKKMKLVVCHQTVLIYHCIKHISQKNVGGTSFSCCLEMN
jgi:hypothetical protein